MKEAGTSKYSSNSTVKGSGYMVGINHRENVGPLPYQKKGEVMITIERKNQNEFTIEHDGHCASITPRTNHPGLKSVHLQAREFFSALENVSRWHSISPDGPIHVTRQSCQTFAVSFPEKQVFVSRFDEAIPSYGSSIQDLRAYIAIDLGYVLMKVAATLLHKDSPDGNAPLPE